MVDSAMKTPGLFSELTTPPRSFHGQPEALRASMMSRHAPAHSATVATGLERDLTSFRKVASSPPAPQFCRHCNARYEPARNIVTRARQRLRFAARAADIDRAIQRIAAVH